jgi:hypothetical protein
LIDSIDTSTVVGLRDPALIGVMTYAFARIGAVTSMPVENYFADGNRWWVRLHEKGGKRHEIPAHHKLEHFFDDYIKAAGIAGEAKSPLFPSAIGRAGAPGKTAYLEAGGTLENAQVMAATRAHARPNFTIAPPTKPRSMRLIASQSNTWLKESSMSKHRSGPVFNAGRDQNVAYSEKGSATQTTHVSNVEGPADIAVLAELQELRKLLAQLGATTASATAQVEQAEKAANGPNPDKGKVIGYVERAVKLSATANGFAEQADRLVPRLQHIAAWAGQTWDSWRPALGL